MSRKGSILAANEPPTKKLQTHVTSIEATALFPDILGIVVESYFLDTKDLGKLLLYTSKRVVASKFPPNNNNDAVWKRLCFSHWGDAASLLPSLRPMYSSEQTFRNFSLICNEQPFVVRPLQHRSSDYVLTFSVHNADSHECLFRVSLPVAEEIPFLFETGGFMTTFDEPLCTRVGEERWTGTVDLVRKSDNKVIQLAIYKFGQSLDYLVEQDEGLWDEGSQDDEMNEHCMSTYGQDLCEGFINKDGKHKRAILGDARIVIFVPELFYKRDELDGDGYCVGVFGFSLETVIVTGRGGYECTMLTEAMEENGVTFQHFFETLEGWNDERIDRSRQSSPFEVLPLMYSASDFLVVVSFHSPDGSKCLFCKSFPGEDIPDFFEKGETDIIFDEPLWNATNHWKTCIYLVRKTDGKFLHLSKSSTDYGHAGRVESLGLDFKDDEGTWMRIVHVVTDDGPNLVSRTYLRDLCAAFLGKYDEFIRLQLHPNLFCKRDKVKGVGHRIHVYGFKLMWRFMEDVNSFIYEAPSIDAIKEKTVTVQHFLEASSQWQDP